MNADLFRGTVLKYKEMRHIRGGFEGLRQKTTIGSSTTFRKYWRDPELIPIGDYFQLMKALNVPQEEQFDILRGK